MNKLLFTILTTCAIMLYSCSNDAGEPGGGLTLVKTLPGGCNNMKSGSLKNAVAENRDTVLFSLRKDTLVMFTGINYICCAPFSTKSMIRNDSLIIRLTETCNYPDENCYCKCMCYYTWEFHFTGFSGGTSRGYAVILDDPRQKEPAVIMKGTIKW